MHENSIEFVRSAIETAFGNLPVPSGQRLLGPLAREDRHGAKKLQQELTGKTWQKLAKETEYLAHEWAAYCYLSPEGYRYYLPALIDSGTRGLHKRG